MNEEKKTSLFSEDDENAYSLDEQEIDVAAEEQTEIESPREKRFGAANIVMLAVILLLAAATIFFMIAAYAEDTPGATSSEHLSKDASLAGTSSEEQNDLLTSDAESGNVEISVPGEEQSGDVSVPEQEQPEQPKEPTFHGMIQNAMGYTYLYYGVAVEQFNGSDKTLDRYVTALDVIRSKLPETATIYHMPVPTHVGYLYNKIDIEIIREDDFYNAYQDSFIKKIADAQKDKMVVVDVYSPLLERYEAGDKLYFNTDANWTADAAYLAYKGFCEARGISPVDLTQYNRFDMENFLGSYYRATEHEELLNNPDVFSYYTNEYIEGCTLTVYNNGNASQRYKLCNNVVNSSTAYLMYLGTNAGEYKIETPCTEERTLLVIGDGSMAAMMPYLVNHYSVIHYIDVGNYKGTIDTFLAENGADDVLFASYLTNAVKGEYPDAFKDFAGMDDDE